MKLEIPCYEQASTFDCGVVSLKMIFDYFQSGISLEEIQKFANVKENKGATIIQLAIAAKKLGFDTSLYSIDEEFDETNLELEFYKENADLELYKNINKLLAEMKSLGVSLVVGELKLDKLLSMLSKDSMLLILLDFNVIRGEEGYRGHFVPIVGYDDENVYVHNFGKEFVEPNLAIKRDVFDKARKAKGTDQDLLVIRGKA